MDTTNSTRTEPAPSDTAHVASTAVEGGKRVAAVGQEEVKNVASTAVEQVGHLAGEVGTQARNLIDESKSQLRTQANAQTDQIASKLREFGDQVQALVEGRAHDSGPVGQYARQTAQTVTQFASRVEDRGFDGIVDDVQRFARRKPGTFLLGAAAAGFGIARLLRAGATTSSSEPSPTTRFTQDQFPPAAPAPYEALDVPPPAPLVDVSDRALAGHRSTEETDAMSMPSVPSMPAPTDPGRIR